MNRKYDAKLKKCTEQLISNDCRTISSFLYNSKEFGIFFLLILPYVALFCREAQEHYKVNVLDKELNDQMHDLRNTIKLLSGKYNKTENKFLEVDDLQDQYFKEQLVYDFTKELNIHYNLGVYFDDNCKVIGDTQLLDIYITSVYKDGELQKENLNKLGMSLAKSLRLISMLSHQINQKYSMSFESLKFGYHDLNTNIDDSFFYFRVNKGLNLFVLHMLSMFGMSKYVLQRFMQPNNTWRLRCEYITAHNIWSGLKVMNEHFKQNRIDGFDVSIINEFVQKGRAYFPSRFRNAMYHYDLFRDSEYSILEDFYRPDILLFGLVESSFSGKNAIDYFSELRSYMDEIEIYLNTWLNYDIKDIKWDL